MKKWKQLEKRLKLLIIPWAILALGVGSAVVAGWTAGELIDAYNDMYPDSPITLPIPEPEKTFYTFGSMKSGE